MRPSRSRWSAANSALVVALLLATAAIAETRPRYGGTLRIETQQAIAALPTSNRVTGQSRLAQQVGDALFSDDPRGCAGKCKPIPGAFRVSEFVPGKRLVLVANDDFAKGRPYLDAIVITMARSARDQRVDFQLGRADVITIPAEGARRALQEGVRELSSEPLELVAIVFSAPVDARVREAVALTADRAAIFNVLLGRQGEPTAALVPNWLSGYAFLFDAGQNVTRARQLAIEAGRARPLALLYDAQDPLARVIAERVALDARAAGLMIAPAVSGPADARLVRILLPPAPQAALAAVASALGGGDLPSPSNAEDLYRLERRLRDDLRVVPLLHLPVVYGVSPRVKGWAPARDGSWELDDVWLEQRP